MWHVNSVLFYSIYEASAWKKKKNRDGAHSLPTLAETNKRVTVTEALSFPWDDFSPTDGLLESLKCH